MKRIEIRNQPSLGFGKTLSLTLTGIRYRLFRSLVTVGVVAVAMAFLMNVLSETLVRRAVLRATVLRTAQLHQASLWVTRLSDPGTLDSILTAMASPRAEAVDEAMSMAELPGRPAPFWRANAARRRSTSASSQRSNTARDGNSCARRRERRFRRSPGAAGAGRFLRQSEKNALAPAAGRRRRRSRVPG